jgi:hypothetical protein
MPHRHDLAALRATLEGALLDATRGDPWGPALEGRLRTVLRHHLLRAGQPQAQVDLSFGPRGVEVRVLLPPDGPRVRAIHLQLSDPR